MVPADGGGGQVRGSCAGGGRKESSLMLPVPSLVSRSLTCRCTGQCDVLIDNGTMEQLADEMMIQGVPGECTTRTSDLRYKFARGDVEKIEDIMGYCDTLCAGVALGQENGNSRSRRTLTRAPVGRV